MPSSIIEHEQDDACDACFGFAREGFEQSLEKFLRHPVGKIPEGFACRRGYEGRDVEPVEPVMTMRDRTLADGRPHAARNRLQANAMLVRGEDLDRLAGMVRCLFGNCIRELFLNAAASSGVADFGFFGRGFWIDQPIAFNASQPRCGATEARLSSPGIQFATLRLHPSRPTGRGAS